MTGNKLIAYARRNAIALLALFVALGGTTYAATSINGKNIKKGTISGKALKSNTLTGTQIKESKLGKVPSATHADSAGSATSATSATTATAAGTALNAAALGGTPAASYVKAGCAPGKINGYAHISGASASFPSIYTTAAPFIANAYNCSGQPVEVRRAGTGAYRIRFVGNPSTIAFGNFEACASNGTIACLAAANRDVNVTQVVGGADDGAFQVVVEAADTNNSVDGRVDVLVP
jgi:hypothetical protein